MRMKIAPPEDGSETESPVLCSEKLLSPGNSYSSCDESPDAPKNCWLLSHSRSIACALPSVLLNVSVIQLMCPSWSWVMVRSSVTPAETKVAQLVWLGGYVASAHLTSASV